MKSKSNRRLIFRIIGAGLAVVVILGLGLSVLPAQDYSLTPPTAAIIQPAVQSQQQIESQIQAYYHSGSFTFDNPLVVQNPYGSAPLTALLIFDTTDSIQVSLHIPGKTPQAAVDFTFAGFARHHEIPVYGLYADMTNQVSLTGLTQAGQATTTVIPLKTEPLPVYLDSVKVIQAAPDRYSPGMNFAFQNNKLVFDINGDIRWYSTASTFQTFTRLANGHYLFTYVVPGEKNNVVMEQDLLGKIYAIYNIPNGVQHDFTELPEGNLLVTSEAAASSTTEDYLIEVDRQSGRIVRSFDLKSILDPARPAEINADPGDWLHLNSIAYDAGDGTILISSRSQSAVIKLTYPGMQIEWILGPHDNWSKAFQPNLLAPQGANFEWQWSQHDASILSEKTVNGSQVIDVLMFDNGNFRSFDKSSALPAGESYSRMVVFQVNETDHTVQQVWEYGKERGSELFSSSQGSAYLLANGDYFGTWADIARDASGAPIVDPVTGGTNTSKVIEVNPANNQVVFEANLAATTSYRTLRANLYDGFSAADSNLTAKLNDTTVMNLGERVVTALQPAKKKWQAVLTWVKAAANKVLKRLGLARLSGS